MLSLPSPGIFSSELDAREPDRFPVDDNSSVSKEIFDITMTDVEPAINPGSVGDDTRWESAQLVGMHRPILPITVTKLGIPQKGTVHASCIRCNPVIVSHKDPAA